MGMPSRAGPSGETLAAAATLAAIQLTQGRTNEQAAVLAAFFTTLGDAIALIAAQRAALEGTSPPSGRPPPRPAGPGPDPSRPSTGP